MIIQIKLQTNIMMIERERDTHTYTPSVQLIKSKAAIVPKNRRPNGTCVQSINVYNERIKKKKKEIIVKVVTEYSELHHRNSRLERDKPEDCHRWLCNTECASLKSSFVSWLVFFMLNIIYLIQYFSTRL